MYPLLFPGDRARVRRCGAGELAAGDVVVFLDLEGGAPRQVAHRLLRASGPAGRRVLRTKGDANFLWDPPLPESAVLGRVEAVVTFGREWPLAPTAARRAGLAAAALAPAPAFLPADGPRAFAGTAALLAARRAVLAAVSGEPTAAPGAAEAAADGFFGFLSRDETWSGAVRLGGDVFVPPGVTLTLAPGTVLDAAPDSLWSLSAPSGRGGPCALHVAGRLTAGGTQTRSRLGGSGAWGGIHASRQHHGGAAALTRSPRDPQPHRRGQPAEAAADDDGVRPSPGPAPCRQRQGAGQRKLSTQPASASCPGATRRLATGAARARGLQARCSGASGRARTMIAVTMRQGLDRPGRLRDDRGRGPRRPGDVARRRRRREHDSFA